MNNPSLYLPLIDDNVTMVRVKFHSQERGEFSGREYTYKCDLHVTEGDVVVVEARAWYGVALVTDTNVPLPIEDDDTVYRWVVDVVDTTDHTSRLNFEGELKKNINKMRVDGMRSKVLEGMGLTSEGIEQIKLLSQRGVEDAEVVLDNDD